MTMEIIPRETFPYNGAEVPVCELETIDFSRLLSHEPPEIKKLLRCCQDAGFFYLDLQDLDGRRMLKDQQQLLALMCRFFASPDNEKNEIGLLSLEHGYDLPPLFLAHTANRLQVMSQLATIPAWRKVQWTVTRFCKCLEMRSERQTPSSRRSSATQKTSKHSPTSSPAPT